MGKSFLSFFSTSTPLDTPMLMKLGTALVMMLALAVPAGAQTKRETLVEVDVAAEEYIAPTSRIIARIVTHPPAAVLASVDAVMTMEALKIGEFVEQGELIATQDDGDLRLKLELNRLNLDMIMERLAQLEDQLGQEGTVRDLLEKQVTLLMGRAERLNQLVTNQVIKRDQFEAVEIQLLTAQRQYAESTGRIMKLETDLNLERIKQRQAEVEQNEIRTDLKAAEIHAPVAGQLIELPASRQRFMREGEVLARILGRGDYEIEADIPVGLLASLRGREMITGMDAEGQPVTVSFRAGLPEENLKTATRPVRFQLASPLTPALMAKGARLELDIPKGQGRPALTVPVDAIISDQDGAIVYVVSEDLASRRVVELGTTIGARVEITAGIAAGEAVIVKGNENLRDGTSVKIVNVE